MTTLRSELNDLSLRRRSKEKKASFLLPAPRDGTVDLLVIAGEHSGDEHGARLLRDAFASAPGLRVVALGGPEITAAGAQLLHDMTASSVVGLVEVLKNYSYFRKLFDATVAWIETHKPRAVLLIDYPGFNLRLAATLRDRGISMKGGGLVKTLFYISPQIWAWKAKRRFSMARDLDALAVIFPFEVSCYADTSLPVTFVGHPFLAKGHAEPVRYDAKGPVLLLPGSRKQAVARIFPALLKGFRASGQREAVVIYPSAAIETVLRAAKPPPNVRLAPTGGEIAASAVLTSSGTMSMHCALAGIPGAIVYRANPITYVLGRWLVKVNYIGIANLLLNEPMYPEFIQGAATRAALAEQLRACIHDSERIAVTRIQSAKLREKLRQPADMNAARWLLERINFSPRSSRIEGALKHRPT